MATVNGTDNDDNLNSTGDPNGDTFEPGPGDDTVNGGAGNDTVIQNVNDPGADRVNLGEGSDEAVLRFDTVPTVRLTFTSAEVGNGNANDAGTLANQDGDLAVRLQVESEASYPAP